MAAYPTSVPYRTIVRPLTSNRVDVADDGTVRAQDLSDENAYELQIIHPLITAAQMSTLTSFYGSNRYSTNTITASDGNSYSFIFAADYEVEQNSATFRTARIRAFGNR